MTPPGMGSEVTGSTLTKLESAATAKYPGTVERAMELQDGTYVVHVVQSNGDGEVHVLVCKDFEVTGVQQGGPPGRDRPAAVLVAVRAVDRQRRDGRAELSVPGRAAPGAARPVWGGDGFRRRRSGARGGRREQLHARRGVLGVGGAGPADALAAAVGLVGLERRNGAGLALGDLHGDRELLELVGPDDPALAGLPVQTTRLICSVILRPSRSTGWSSFSR